MLFKKQKIRKKNRKGQIAIFLLMVFQLLFVLFAMTVNVALTVHDKINLQNSVDLATLYGAKKQAEVLNAIAHINFQMRQNYKLLAWRFRVLSTVTVKNTSPMQIVNREWCPQNKFRSLRGDCERRYAACFSTDLWRRGIDIGGQNLCTNQGVRIEAPPPIPNVAPFVPVNFTASNRQMTLRSDLLKTCNAESFINWLMTQVFLSHFRLDQKDRKMMIHAIYNASLKQGLDLDGNPIEEGVTNTFTRNLTLVNKQNAPALEVFNSLEGQDITNFLEPQNIFPVLEYLYFGNGAGNLREDNACNIVKQAFSSQDAYRGGDFITRDDVVAAYKPYVTEWLWLFNLNQSNPPNEQFITPLTLGYNKNPNLTVYYGVSATLTHQQLFSPSSSLQLKASAFAKPFGGRIGPEAGKDRRITVDPKPNYSRYPGDAHGLRHEDAHRKHYLIKSSGRDSNDGWKFFNVNNYADLTIGDALATDTDTGYNFVLRVMEMMAISPNIFDLLNYSISNNYMETYFPRICELIGPGGGCNAVEGISASVPGAPLPGYIRGDFGHPHTGSYTTKNQTETVSSFVPFFFFPGSGLAYRHTLPRDFGGIYGYPEKPPYLIKDPAHFLSGFMPSTNPYRYNDYGTPDPAAFMKCYKPTKKDYHIPSGCAVGGRSGYSVKLISCETVDTQPGIKPTNLNPIYCQ